MSDYQIQLRARRDKYFPLIAAQIDQTQNQVVLDDGKFILNGEDVTGEIDLSPERPSYGYRYQAKPDAKIRIILGQWGSKKQFPQRKDGTHNYSGIAARLVRIVEDRKQSRVLSEIQHNTDYRQSNQERVEPEPVWAVRHPWYHQSGNSGSSRPHNERTPSHRREGEGVRDEASRSAE